MIPHPHRGHEPASAKRRDVAGLFGCLLRLFLRGGMTMKYIISALSLLIALTMLVACGTSSTGNEAGVGAAGTGITTAESVVMTERDEEVTENVGLSNPWTDHHSLEDAIAAVGFDFRIPYTIMDLAPSAYRTMDGVLEVIYETPADSESQYLCFTLRKGANDADISGNSTTYSQIYQESRYNRMDEPVEITFQGNDDVYTAAHWVQDGHFYSLLAAGIEEILPPENGENNPGWWVVETIVDHLIALNEDASAMEVGSAPLPPYVYPGTDEQIRAITAYMTNRGRSNINSDGSVSIPAPVIFKREQIDDTHAIVWGNFWTLRYVLDGTVLLCLGGGEAPGLLTMEKRPDGWLVTDAEFAGDGSLYVEDIQRFCEGDKALEEEYFTVSGVKHEKVESVRTQFIADYVQANGLNVTAYQDQGWNPIELTAG